MSSSGSSDPSSKYYVNEMDRASDNYRPAMAYGYVNGSDLQSDNVYNDRERVQATANAGAEYGSMGMPAGNTASDMTPIYNTPSWDEINAVAHRLTGDGESAARYANGNSGNGYSNGANWTDEQARIDQARAQAVAKAKAAAQTRAAQGASFNNSFAPFGLLYSDPNANNNALRVLNQVFGSSGSNQLMPPVTTLASVLSGGGVNAGTSSSSGAYMSQWDGTNGMSVAQRLTMTAQTIDSIAANPVGSVGYVIGKATGMSEGDAATLAAIGATAGDLLSLKGGPKGRVSEGTRIINGTPIRNPYNSADSVALTFKENSFIYATGEMNFRPGREGELSVSMRTYANEGTGRVRIDGFTGATAYDQIFDYFGNRVTSVRNTYISDDESAFNKAISQNLSLQDAAKSTWDGQYLMKRGFNEVHVTAEKLPTGEYRNINATWKKK